MRRALSLVSSVALTGVLVACGSSDDSGVPTRSGSGGSSGHAGASGAIAAGSGGQANATAGSGGAAGGGGNSAGGIGGSIASAGAAAGGASAGSGGSSAGGNGGVSAASGMGGAVGGAGGSVAGAGGAPIGGNAGTVSGGAGGTTQAGGAGTGGAAQAGSGGISGAFGAGAGGTNGGSTNAGGTAGSAGGGSTIAPNAPTGVTIDVTTSAFAVNVTWVRGSTNETGFNIYWSTDDTEPATAGATVGPGVTSYKLTQVLGAQTYRFWIEAVNGAGKSAPAKGVAGAPTQDLTWNELWLDDNSNIHLAMKDTFGLLADTDPATQLYAYQSADASAMGNATPINPYVIWYTPSYNIDLTKAHYFWAEARTPAGSLFSERTLTPAAAVTGLAAVPTDTSASLSWTATPNAVAYQTFWGQSSFDQATALGSAVDASRMVTGLNPGVTYSFWVRALAAGIGGNGFPGPAATISSKTTGTALGPNLALGKTAVASSENGFPASNVTDGNYGTRWQSNFDDPEWIYVNLGDGNAANITHVKLVWEAAYSKSFDIQVCAATCDDGGTAPDTWAWTTAYSADRSLAGPFPYFELIQLTNPTMGQFVRLRGNSRGTVYGHSLWEMEVYSAP